MDGRQQRAFGCGRFLQGLGVFVAAGALVLTVGCDDPVESIGDFRPPIPSYPAITNKAATVSNNHGHTVGLTKAVQETRQPVTVELTSGSGHTHTLSLNTGQVQGAASGLRVEEMSSTTLGHSHAVVFDADAGYVSTSAQYTPSAGPATGSSATTSDSTTTSGSKSGYIYSNHGHKVSITKAELDSGWGVDIYLTVGSGHTHEMYLTSYQVQQIKAGTFVSDTTYYSLGHHHVVTFN